MGASKRYPSAAEGIPAKREYSALSQKNAKILMAATAAEQDSGRPGFKRSNGSFGRPSTSILTRVVASTAGMTWKSMAIRDPGPQSGVAPIVSESSGNQSQGR
jgi:hypothetical protein